MNLIKRLEAIKPKDTDPTPIQQVICDCMDVAIRETNATKTRILERLDAEILGGLRSWTADKIIEIITEAFGGE